MGVLSDASYFERRGRMSEEEGKSDCVLIIKSSELKLEWEFR